MRFSFSPKAASAWADYSSLIDAIDACIQPDSWKENAGQGDLRQLHPGFLVVLQTTAVHEEIARLLTALREMREEPPVGTPPLRY